MVNDMMKRLLTLAIVAIAAVNVMAQDDNTERLWYDKPANIWLEALPVGNGRLGGMIFGGTETEEIQLNEDSFWSGGPHNNNSTTSAKYIDQVRSLIFEGKEKEAEDLINQQFIKGPHGMKYLTLGSLTLTHDGIHAAEVTGYRRELDLQTALSSVSFEQDGHHYSRTTFASIPDQVIVMRLETDTPSGFTIQHKAPYTTTYAKSTDGQMATISGVDHEGIAAKLKAALRYQVESDGEVTYTAGGKVTVKNYTKATVYIAAATNYVNYKNVNGKAGTVALSHLNDARQHDYDELLKRHTEAYQAQYNRVHLYLPSAAANSKLTTEKRLDKFAGSTDWGMVALLFNYGRYLLISSSQPGGQPANLQGLWNDKKDAPWDSKYTININAEMNYWPSEVCNLTETNDPFFGMIRDLSETGAKTAKTMYGCGGWVAHHNTDLWRIAGPVDGAFWGMYPNGGAWLATHLWQHYLYTGDVAFLREWYPVIKGTADFYLDYMQPHPGYNNWLVVVPSVSPRRRHAPPPHLAPLRSLPLQPDQSLQPQRTVRRRQADAHRPRRRGYRLEPRLEDLFLGTYARRHTRPHHLKEYAQAAAVGECHGAVPQRPHLPQPVRCPPALPDRRQLRCHCRHCRDAAAESRRCRAPAARPARGMEARQCQRSASPWRLRGGYGMEHGHPADGHHPLHHRRHTASALLRRTGGRRVATRRGRLPQPALCSGTGQGAALGREPEEQTQTHGEEGA